MSTTEFRNYDEFFSFYLRAHSHPGNRFLHCCGTLIGLAVVAGALATGHPWYALLFPVIGYGFAWTGHFVVEGNRPATFGHPWWSFISDFRMVWLILTGQIGKRMTRANNQVHLGDTSS